MSSGPALVFVESTPMTGRARPVVHDMTIGRQGCDVILADPEVSRRHAIVLQTAAGPAIEDLGSTNGTWINGRRLEGAQLLRAGDELRFGNTVWHVRVAGADRDATATVAREVPVAPHGR